MTQLRGVEGPTILGTGKALPSRQAPVAVGVTSRQAGVETRFWTHTPGAPADHSEITSQDLAIAAAEAALGDSGLPAAAIDGLIMVTTTPPRPSVSTANHVARALDLGGFAFELKAGCAGGVYGLVVAASLLGLGLRNVLVVAAEAWTKLLPGDAGGPAEVAGDGAGAVVLGRGAGALLGSALHVAPAYAAAMMPPGLYPPTAQAIADDAYQLRITADVAEAVRDVYPKIFDEALAAAGLDRDAVDLLILHQASRQILRRALRDCGVPGARTYNTLARFGNVSSASVLLSLHEARAEGRLAPGSRVALVAVGGGIAGAAAVLRV